MQEILEDARTCSTIEANGKFGTTDCSKIVHIVAHIGPGGRKNTAIYKRDIKDCFILKNLFKNIDISIS